jgi:hypothetical protein
MKKRLVAVLLFVFLIAVLAPYAKADSAKRGYIQGRRATLGSPKKITLEYSEKLPSIDPETRSRLEKELVRMPRRRPAPKAYRAVRPVPPPKGSAINPENLGPLLPLNVQRAKQSFLPMAGPAFAPSDMVFFLGSNVLPKAVAASQSIASSNINEPTVAQSGKTVLVAGNWYLARSADGGLTWSYASPSDGMPDFCCDQDVIYDRGRNLFLWYRQGRDSPSTNGNRVILAASTDEGQTWCQYELAPSFLNPAWTSNADFDYPQLSLTNNNVYLMTGMRGEGTPPNVVLRFSLDAMAGCSGMTVVFWLSNFSVFAGAVEGATTTMYFGDHQGLADSFRIYQQRESETGISWKDVSIPAWQLEEGAACPLNAAQNCCPSPDGTNWCLKSDSTIRAGWAANGAVGFMWDAKQGGPFPFPYVEGAIFDTRTFAYMRRAMLWSDTGALHYPHAGVNARGDVAVSLFYSSNKAAATPHLAVMDDYSATSPGSWQVYRLFNGSQGSLGWGDYIRTRAFEPSQLGWVTSVYTIQQGAAEPLFYIVGRGRDIPSIENWWSK